MVAERGAYVTPCHNTGDTHPLAQAETPDLIEAYEALTGETPEATLLRRRLHRAARQLLRTKRSLEEIALAANFPDSRSFACAFESVFGMTAATYRARGQLVKPHSAETNLDHLYQAEIEQRAPLRVAGLRHLGCYHEQGHSLDRLYGWAASQGLSYRDSRTYSFFHDDPFVTPEALLSSHVCLAVPDHIKASGEVQVFDLPGGTYATALHQGHYAELEQPYFWLTRWWAPQSGHLVKPGPFLAEFLNLPRGLPPTEWLTRMAVPLL